MTYKEHLEKIKFFANKTIEIYLKYAMQLEMFDLDYKQMLVKHNGSINSKRLMISAIKSYYKFLQDDRWKLLSLPKKETNFQDYVTFDEYQQYIRKINRKTKTGLQKLIIVRLLFETGIRATELLNIRKSDIHNNRIIIHGKGRKQRCVFISEWLKFDLMEYLQHCSEILFPFGYKNLYNKIKILNKHKRLSLHMFRRGYAKHCYSKDISIYDISLSMGHSSIETTACYIKRRSEDINISKIFS